MKPIRVLRHVAQEELGNLEVVLRNCGAPLQVIDCFRDDWPAIRDWGLRPQECSGLVVMGGTMNADQTDRHPFLATEVEWLRQAVAAQLPVLGICLGAQLLAKSLGAGVYANAIKEIGWYEVELLPAAESDLLLQGGVARETVFQWHGDTFDLPAGGVHLVRGATCRHQAFRYGPTAWGFQFHLEITAEMVADWLVEDEMCAEVAACDHIDPREIRRRTPEALASMAALSERVFGRFASVCRQRN